MTFCLHVSASLSTLQLFSSHLTSFQMPDPHIQLLGIGHYKPHFNDPPSSNSKNASFPPLPPPLSFLLWYPTFSYQVPSKLCPPLDQRSTNTACERPEGTSQAPFGHRPQLCCHNMNTDTDHTLAKRSRVPKNNLRQKNLNFISLCVS